ncbi:hypothetical protein HAX54_041125 [Datura stramonium]|uniref:Retrotransposon gag domain-containing protein n=1 Tax=Datura stramonium TaxID=4076 RepID=A0ABS8SKX7_DATST|nr:hypothetical protein [Datura stramonium]
MCFVKKWFPPSKKVEQCEKIFHFRQVPGEQLFDVWKMFKQYILRAPTNGFPNNILSEKFYIGLDDELVLYLNREKHEIEQKNMKIELMTGAPLEDTDEIPD